MEKHVRSLAKTISRRIVATSIAFLLIFLFTENIVISPVRALSAPWD